MNEQDVEAKDVKVNKQNVETENEKKLLTSVMKLRPQLATSGKTIRRESEIIATRRRVK